MTPLVSKFSASKKVALVSQSDLKHMKEEEKRKKANQTNQEGDNNENDDLSAEERRRKILGLDPLPEAPPPPRYAYKRSLSLVIMITEEFVVKCEREGYPRCMKQ